ncbi:stimulus-sensing domain-containing protein [Pelagibacterium halotolerans]|uniref:stimulus-sensing domain-containing protein n=1 Tax=Pelagibacterium halotolerans TaxID=531813 RepID=UPI00384E04F8
MDDRISREQSRAAGAAGKSDADKAPKTVRKPFLRPVFAFAHGVGRVINFTFFASLTRRIVILNLVALAALVAGILYLNSFRSGLIDVRVQSLRVQGEIIAAAIAASATADSDVISVNPDRLLDFYQGQVSEPFSFFDPTLQFPINPERIAPLLRNLVTPTRTRARIYDDAGLMILDSNNIYASGEILRSNSTTTQTTNEFFLFEWWSAISRFFGGGSYPRYQDYGVDEGLKYPEVASALSGSLSDIVREDERGQLVVSVAVPIQRQRAVIGALLLSTSPGDIDAIVAQERWSILRIAAVAATVTGLMSVLLAGTIAGPMRRLSEAAERVQTSMKARAEIPDYTDRSDEIGHLSGSLRAMTNALYNRIEAIERFAADVAHELKNPLTSLRSAVETLPLAKSAADRERLAEIIQHDVRRLDRLISDISNASRIDAELARENTETVNIAGLAEAIVSIQSDLAAKSDVSVVLKAPKGKVEPVVKGHDNRLAQVFTNLIDNAVSFSPSGGVVTVSVSVAGDTVVTRVMDEGRGISGDAEKVFQRFYTDRPEGESFGDHSGLGLSISRQIAQAHKGTLEAGNRDDRSGAVFTLTLPRAKT